MFTQAVAKWLLHCRTGVEYVCTPAALPIPAIKLPATTLAAAGATATAVGNRGKSMHAQSRQSLRLCKRFVVDP